MQVDKRALRQRPPKPSGLCLLRVVRIPLCLLLTLRLPGRDRTRWEGLTPDLGKRGHSPKGVSSEALGRITPHRSNCPRQLSGVSSAIRRKGPPESSVPCLPTWPCNSLLV